MNEELIYGKWLYQDKSLKIEISIDQEKVTISFNDNGQEYSETFKSGNCHWFGPAAIFLDHGQYFFDQVDEHKLHFGKLGEQPVVSPNNVEWAYWFERVELFIFES